MQPIAEDDVAKIEAQRSRLDRNSTWRRSAVGPWNRSVSRIDSCRVRIEKAAFEKRRAAADWTPEYKPASIVSPNKTASAVADIYTVSSLAMITEEFPVTRKTKIVCTLGPSCWSKDGLSALVDAGMGIARFNFSHGDHAGHQEVLDRLRTVLEEKDRYVAAMLDTKGPEIRTAMLRGGKDITIEAGQEVKVVAVGAEYTKWEGYKDEETGETVIGCSYAALCSSVHAGSLILCADGTLTLQVVEVGSREVLCTALNKKVLGQRKNMNLPGVKVDLPVLTDKDIDDVQNFCCKNNMDFIAASFVQTAADVRYIRRILDEAGGQHIKIMCKIESMHGLINYDEILKETDGIMVARGDLAMEIPSEKVALAQKLMITKANIAGKFVICATEMLASMAENPLPTRAEMTDVANAVFDGVDGTMMSGETANGKFPDLACQTMARINENAELAIMHEAAFRNIRYRNAGLHTVSALEAMLSNVAKMAMDFTEDADGNGVIEPSETCFAVVITQDGTAANLISKYRPACPVFVISSVDHVLRQANAHFAQIPLKANILEGPDQPACHVQAALAVLTDPTVEEFMMPGQKIIVVTGVDEAAADRTAQIEVMTVVDSSHVDTQSAMVRVPSRARLYTSPYFPKLFISLAATSIGLDIIEKPVYNYRATNIFCTLGPACWSEEKLGSLIDAGLGVARFNFSHGNHADHQAVLDRFRKVAKEKGEEWKRKRHLPCPPTWAVLLDTKGPEIRTAMLKDHQPIMLEAGQKVIIRAVGDAYTSWEGYKTAEETKIGVSYAKLCQDVSAGQTILIADGTICIQVDGIINKEELQGTVLNSNKLGERKNVNLPGVQVDIPVLTAKDIDDLQNFCCRNKMDFVAASFVQSGDDVRFIRKTLDDAGGQDIKIICKIENAAGLQNYGDILHETDGIMVARGDLGMEIPSEKVAIAQKMMITRARLAGKFVVTATQMLASMEYQPLPTRAEMTDVANAVFDGSDSVMLSGETANGSFPDKAVSTMAAIVKNAEVGIDRRVFFNHVSRFTPKPMPTLEAVCRSAAQASLDMQACAILVITSSLDPVCLIAKYRCLIPIIVATNSVKVANQCRAVAQAYGMLLEDRIQSRSEALAAAIKYGRGMGFATFDKQDIIVVAGKSPVVLGDGPDMRDARVRMYRMGTGTANLIKAAQYSGQASIAYRSEQVSIDLLTKPVTRPRKTKIVCTLGPACWSEEGLAALLEAGMNVGRFNFSHGDHAGHQAVLDRLRQVAAAKGINVAVLLDTKGPEIRTAMLRDGKPIMLEKGQPIIVEAVGAAYTEFQGYKEEGGETRIGVSYDKLCETMSPGLTILIADGTICIRVEEVLSGKELRGTVLNSAKLGERKNVNLPGVQVDIPVLTAKDITDLQEFAAKNSMDYVAASFVQTADDVRFIRWTLDEAGGQNVKIICKIENEAGLRNFDDILLVCDGIMVARGDLGMEIPSEKVAIAQKLMITKANIAGKRVIVATQMLASMENNPLPTRAEMTDVANAVFDGTDAVMLSGESANGSFPSQAVATMARIVVNAEQGINSVQNFNFIRNFTPKPLGELQAIMCSAVKLSLDIDAGLIIVLSRNGVIARMVAKYRPRVATLLVTDSEEAARHANLAFSVYAYKKDKLPLASTDELVRLVDESMTYAVNRGLCAPGKEVVVISGVIAVTHTMSPSVAVRVAPGLLSPYKPQLDTRAVQVRTGTLIKLDDVVSPYAPPRKVKIICTLGPACWSEEGLAELIDSGMNIARFNFSHGDHKGHQEVLDRVRRVASMRNSWLATMLDTKGPEIRTAMLREGKDLDLKKGQEVILVAVGDEYTTWEGFHDPSSGETRIGCSYAKLCSSVKEGSNILVADGTLSIRVKQVLSETEVLGECLNNKVLGQRKNMNLPGVKVDLPVLTEKDIDDVQNFCCKNNMDFISVSFVQTAEDVQLVRQILDEAGGEDVQIIAKIESMHGLINYDEILQEVNGIMVARGDLAMEIPPEKVSLAQKMMITKANVAGKFIFCATEMLASMAENPLPTRAEMTDVANAVFDGVDGTMLSGESANGKFPTEAVQTMARIVRNADMTASTYIHTSYLRDHTSKPFSALESMGSAVCFAALDSNAGLLVTISDSGRAAGYVSKYRAPVPQMVVSTREQTLRHCNGYFGQVPVHVSQLTTVSDLVQTACEVAVKQGYWSGEGIVVVVHGREGPDADHTPAFRAIHVSLEGSAPKRDSVTEVLV